MKHIVSDHALALGKPFMFELNGVQNEMQMYECGNTGLLFALDATWLEDQDEETPLAIPSFVDEGTSIILVDTEEEINLNLNVVGDEHSDQLIESVMTKIIGDIKAYDLNAIQKLLHFIPNEMLINYLGIK